jgi:hypothetical protein
MPLWSVPPGPFSNKDREHRPFHEGDEHLRSERNPNDTINTNNVVNNNNRSESSNTTNNTTTNNNNNDINNNNNDINDINNHFRIIEPKCRQRRPSS